MLIDNKTLGENIRKCRQSKNMTMKQLAKIVGVSEQAISQYELGKRTVKIEQLQKIAVAFDVSFADFVLDADKLNLDTSDDYDSEDIELLKMATPELLSEKQREAIRIYDEMILQGVNNWQEFQKKHFPNINNEFNFIEHNLIKEYRKLNELGKDYLKQTIEMLVNNPAFSKIPEDRENTTNGGF